MKFKHVILLLHAQLEETEKSMDGRHQPSSLEPVPSVVFTLCTTADGEDGEVHGVHLRMHLLIRALCS